MITSALKVTPAIRMSICYVPGVGAILLGIAAGFLQIITLPFSELLIGDCGAFQTSEGLERAGAQLGPWRAATDADIDEASIMGPADQCLVREATIDAYFHHIRVTLARDKRDARFERAIRLHTQWRVGYALSVISLTTLIPIAVGWSWIRLLRSLLGLWRGHIDDTKGSYPTQSAGGSI